MWWYVEQEEGQALHDGLCGEEEKISKTGRLLSLISYLLGDDDVDGEDKYYNN